MILRNAARGLEVRNNYFVLCYDMALYLCPNTSQKKTVEVKALATLEKITWVNSYTREPQR